jgi:hypothetical protein
LSCSGQPPSALASIEMIPLLLPELLPLPLLDPLPLLLPLPLLDPLPLLLPLLDPLPLLLPLPDPLLLAPASSKPTVPLLPLLLLQANAAATSRSSRVTKNFQTVRDPRRRPILLSPDSMMGVPDLGSAMRSPRR